MARAALKCVFAALLALSAAQAVVPSARVAAAIEAVCGTEADRQPRIERRLDREIRIHLVVSLYESRPTSEPDTAVLFQRPPPATSLFS